MKTLLLVIVLLIFTPKAKSVVGIYQLQDRWNSIHLEVSMDKTYKFKSQGDSCWLWADFSGNWKIANDTLILENKNSIEVEVYQFLIKKNKLRAINAEYIIGRNNKLKKQKKRQH